MTFPTGVVEKRKSSDEEMKAMLAESKEACKHSRKLGRVMNIVAHRRLQQLKHLHAREQLATWRKTHGYNRIADSDDSWALRPRPPSPEEFTASLWSGLQELKDTISIAARDRSRQRAKRFIQELKQGTVSMNLTAAELAMLKRFVEERNRDTAHVTAAPANIAQYRSPSSPSPEITFDACVCVDMKENNEEGRMNPEPTEVKLPPADTGLETLGQQYPPNGETGRTTADGCLLVGVGSNSGGNVFFSAEIAVGTRVDSKITTAPTARNITLLQARRKPNDKKA